MTLYEHVDPTTTQMEALLWSLVPVVAEQAGVTQADALYHVQRAWTDRLKAMKVTEGVDYRDDGRAAAWRVRLMVWRTDATDQAVDLIADSDPQSPFGSHNVGPGATIIHGLPSVSEWVRELISVLHDDRDPGATIDGLSPATLATKLKSLRVALSKSAGHTVWRLRYAVTAPLPLSADGAPSLKTMPARPGLQHFCAYVYVTREAPAPRHMRESA